MLIRINVINSVTVKYGYRITNIFENYIDIVIVEKIKNFIIKTFSKSFIIFKTFLTCSTLQ